MFHVNDVTARLTVNGGVYHRVLQFYYSFTVEKKYFSAEALNFEITYTGVDNFDRMGYSQINTMDLFLERKIATRFYENLIGFIL